MTNQNLRYMVKEVMRGKFIAIQAQLKKIKKILNKHLNPTSKNTRGKTKQAQGKQKEGNIIKIRAELNDIEMKKKQFKESMYCDSLKSNNQELVL